ncbi:type II toxin-antitoxin system RelE family toxin [Rhizobium alvei]|uniref:Type II toxin-antitoxin system RelE/ParE family toxin n=1 Tax=Rhizobium alvei TaxID=1132659 RepID=A0ABT8YKP2_9HYPH|nr:type II toxin-antitoxin system RelE/ParE family toxin [Rhizobium alvei]MDO6964303.1 type II toxin-antitoxin system RelE/ParE family toxin [Rhizobium alvei]
MVWAIELDSSVEKQLEKLAPDDAKRILKHLRERVAKDENPRRLGKALVGKQFANLWRYRVGDYRIICRIEDQRLVILVIKLGHRRDIYK